MNDPVRNACISYTFTNTRLRRHTKTRVTVVRHGIDYTTSYATPPGISVSNIKTGTAAVKGSLIPVGYVSVDVDVGNVSPGNANIEFRHSTGGFTLPVQIVRRGVITGFVMAPNPGSWGQAVSVHLTGQDIGNTGISVLQHAITMLVSSHPDTLVMFKATGSGSPLSSVTIKAFDKTLGDPAGLYYFKSTNAIAYAAPPPVTSCATVPGLGAPELGSPPNGQVVTFSSATIPSVAPIPFTWAKVADPQNRYILQVDLYTTTSKSPLSISTDTVTGEGTSSTAVSKAKNLPRNRQYKWKARAINCGIGTPPWSSIRELTVK